MPNFDFIPEAPTPVGLQKQLFIDDYVVAEKSNVSLDVGQAKKHGVVIEPTLLTEFQSGAIHDGPDGGFGFESHFCWFFSPHWDSDKAMFRLWYMAGKRAGTGLSYAESSDGFNWTKPMISKDGVSNLVTWNSPVPILRRNESVDLLDIGLDGTTVTIDPSLEFGSPKKFKVAFYPNSGGIDGKTRLGYSADGIHWNLYHDGVVNILGLTLITQFFGTDNTSADTNGDGAINILVLVANHSYSHLYSYLHIFLGAMSSSRFPVASNARADRLRAINCATLNRTA